MDFWNFEQVQESKDCKIWTKDIPSTFHPKTKVYMVWELGAWSSIVFLDLQVVTIFIFLWMISIRGFILFKGNHCALSLGQHQNFDSRKERKTLDNVGRCGASKSRATTCVGAL
jgi:hypothetical protein